MINGLCLSVVAYAQVNDKCPYDDCLPTDGLGLYILVSYLPLVFAAIVSVVLLWKLKGYNLIEALSTDHDPANTVPSASRLIAFIGGVSALIFSFCLFVFYTTVYIRTGYAPNIENLTNALIALGVGVVPYSINKVAGAIERRNKN